MTAPAALVTEVATSASGGLAVEPTVVPVVPGPASAEAADVTDWSAPGFSSLVAAWACLEKRSSRNKIPAAAIANCAARTATRYASSCDIDSSTRWELDHASWGKKSPGSAMHG